MNVERLIQQLRQNKGLRSKRDIQPAAQIFPHQPFPNLGHAALLGDDAAVLPAQNGSLLMACEGMHPTLVANDPWFAGWCGVLVNLSDIAAMGGRPIAVLNSIWTRRRGELERMQAGMQTACERFAVPMVGGHSNQQSPYDALSVAVLGVTEGPILSARAAEPGDELWWLINHNGSFYKHYPFWDAATAAPGEQLRDHLALLPALAKDKTIHAAKDISMGGITGTTAMFAEACGLTITLNRNAIRRPSGVGELKWLTCFPSFGFLLAVQPSKTNQLRGHLNRTNNLTYCPIGCFSAGEAGVFINDGDSTHTLWRSDEGLTGFGCA
ncbi:sll0787 family AIR synthase-like protein [Synechococcus sp. MIT S1220]|uniref:sll0787 family AIR synthase-like protein n=1 Tax=Synechococcus sp. MIT S1220 TaxID=3082549 RepID=UPI0039B0F482